MSEHSSVNAGSRVDEPPREREHRRLTRSPTGRAQPLPTAAKVDRLPDAVRAVDKRPDAMRVVDMDAGWRDDAPTEKQLAYLTSRKIPTPRKLTRGQASWIIMLSGQRQRPR